MGYLGVDVGSLYASIVLIDNEAQILNQAYIRHHGAPLAGIRQALSAFPLDLISSVARTGSGGEALPLPGQYINAVVAGVEGVLHLDSEIRNIISIGGGSFSLTQLNDDGSYRTCTTNTACASGTGAFLDQQALRLQINPSELSEKANTYQGKPPGVATRCAVFAKSDMIHLQQEGFGTDAIAAGLCAGLGHSTVDGLLGGHSLEGKTLCIGGVSKNRVVVNAVQEKLGISVTVPQNPELVGALGAALYARKRGEHVTFSLSALDDAKQGIDNSTAAFLRAPLRLELSHYPVFVYHDYWIDEDKSEIALMEAVNGTIPVTLGIDIGSTSTKAALLDRDQKVVAWIYRKTAGDPIRAVQKLFQGIRRLQTRANITFLIQGVGTTGSGRKMIGALIGADLAINEITAHAKAAVYIDPEVDTILELGGQDAKFTQLSHGVVYNSVMNYVCAAGTGSFIEEQALKLGLPITDFADFAMNVECPATSDRCTVYMERDLDLLLAKGWSKSAVAAAVLHSVRDNYLNKVVGGLYIGNHVFFQGATARNKALVAAFEAELKVPVQVSTFCHVTGALGMCLLVRERITGASSFKGLSFADEEIRVESETCELCHNLCHLSIIHTGHGTVAWGLKCGRDYGDTKVKVKKVTGFDGWLGREKAWLKLDGEACQGPRIGIPRALGVYGYLPLWRNFFRALGCEPVLSPRSNDKLLKTGTQISTAEYCAPVLMSLGHVKHLCEQKDVDFIFIPQLIREENPYHFTDSHFCCYLQAHAGVAKSIHGLPFGGRLLDPIIQFCKGEEYMVEQLCLSLEAPLKKNREEIRRAWKTGLSALADFRRESVRLGEITLKKISEEEQLGIVVIGRPYNSLDAGMTLDLPKKMADMGYNILFLDQLPLDFTTTHQEYPNMYWHYGQKILAAADYVLKADNLFGVYFTNFMCGPDSYLLSYFKEIMNKKDKPYLLLQLDGHGADAGYLTRIEAALESFHSWKGIPRPAEIRESSVVKTEAAGKRTIS